MGHVRLNLQYELVGNPACFGTGSGPSASILTVTPHLQALMALRETNEAAFFGLIAEDVTGFLPIVYTPTVGKACQNWCRNSVEVA